MAISLAAIICSFTNTLSCMSNFMCSTCSLTASSLIWMSGLMSSKSKSMGGNGGKGATGAAAGLGGAGGAGGAGGPGGIWSHASAGAMTAMGATAGRGAAGGGVCAKARSAVASRLQTGVRVRE